MNADEVAAAIDRARQHYAKERAEYHRRWCDLDEDLREVTSCVSNAEDPAARAALKRAFDLAYEITGECEQLEPIAKLIGYEETGQPWQPLDQAFQAPVLEGGEQPVAEPPIAAVTLAGITADRIATALERIADRLESSVDGRGIIHIATSGAR